MSSSCTPFQCVNSSTSNSTSFTCDQLMSYCVKNQRLQSATSLANLSLNYLIVSSESIAIVAYVLMALTLRKMFLSKTTYIYYQVMVVLEFVNANIGLTAGVLGLYPPANSFWSVFWIRQLVNGWLIADWLQLAVCAMVAVVSMERAVAVLWPKLFVRLDRPALAWFAVVLSSILGASHLVGIWTTEVRLQANGQFAAISTPFKSDRVFLISLQVTYFVKVISSVVIFLFSSATIFGLRRRSRKIAEMGVRARDDWIKTSRLCVLSLIIGMSTLVHNVTWVIYKYHGDSYSPVIDQRSAVANSNVERAFYDLWYAEMLLWMKLIQAAMGTVVHQGRFFIYLCLSESFRHGFKAVIGRGVTSSSGGSDRRSSKN